MADNLVLHVSNIPSALYEEDLVKDKLLIHFLRRSNGGNGEISIWYPTEEDGVALLTFDQQEVALRVLRRSHVLEIKQQSYSLEVELLEVKQQEAEQRKAEWLEAERLKVERLEAKRQKAERLKTERMEAERLRTERMEAEQLEAERQRAKQLEAEQMKAKQLEAERLKAKQLEMNQLKAGLSQFSMPIRTKLSLQHFSDTSEVQKVIEKHNLKCKKRNLELFIQGDFHDLSRCRDELYEKLRTSISFVDVDNHMTLIDQQNSEEHYLEKNVSKKEDHRQKAHQNDRSSSTVNQNISVRMVDQSSECEPGDAYSSDLGRNGRSGKRSPKTSNARSASGSRNLAFTITKPAEGLPVQSIQQGDTVTKSSSSQRKLTEIQGFDANSCKRKPKETIADDLPSSPKHPKNVCADGTSDQRKYKDSATNSFNPTSFTETHRPSSRSTTDDFSRPTQSRNNPSQNMLVKVLFVDPAVLTYIKSFKTKIIDNILSRAHAQMNTENDDQVIKVVLTAKSADLPEEFYKGVLEISDIFHEYQHCLWTKSINLSCISEPLQKEVTRTLQLYLHQHEIWSSPDNNILFLIGPSRDVIEFIVKWRAAKGDIRNFLQLVRDEDAPNPSHQQKMEMDNLKLTTNRILNEDKTLGRDSASVNRRTAYNSGLSSDPTVARTNAGEDITGKLRNAKDTFRVNTSTGKNTPRNQDAVDRNSSPEHPKDNTSDDFTSRPQNSADLATKQTSSSSSMGASRSASESCTANLSAPKHLRNNLDHIPLSTECLVDSSVLSYVTFFRKHEIDNILSQAYVKMRTEPGDEFTNIVFTAEFPDTSEHFYNATREILGIFSEYGHYLRQEKIVLSNISQRQKENIITMLLSYLFHHHIWSSVDENILHLIGPSEKLFEFKEKWRANKEDMVAFLLFVTKRESWDPSARLVEGINSLHLSTPSNDLTYDAQGHTERPVSSSQEPGIGTRGVSPQSNVIRNKTLPNHSHDAQGHTARPASSRQEPGTTIRGVSPQPNVTNTKTLPSHSHDVQGHTVRPASSSQELGTRRRGASSRPNVTPNKAFPNHPKPFH